MPVYDTRRVADFVVIFFCSGEFSIVRGGFKVLLVVMLCVIRLFYNQNDKTRLLIN